MSSGHHAVQRGLYLLSHLSDPAMGFMMVRMTAVNTFVWPLCTVFLRKHESVICRCSHCPQVLMVNVSCVHTDMNMRKWPHCQVTCLQTASCVRETEVRPWHQHQTQKVTNTSYCFLLRDSGTEHSFKKDFECDTGFSRHLRQMNNLYFSLHGRELCNNMKYSAPWVWIYSIRLLCFLMWVF